MNYDKKEIVKKFEDIKQKFGFSLFSNSKIFNKNIVIMDMEMNGQRYFPEIIEFFGIKINNGNIIDSLYFECKPKKKIVKEVIEKVTGKDNNYYLDKKAIEEYKDLLIPFLKDSILCCYDWAYDFQTLRYEYKNKFNIAFPLNSKIIDGAYLIKEILNISRNIRLDKNNNDINNERKYHNAIDDVFILIDKLYDINYFCDEKEINLYSKLYVLINEQKQRKIEKQNKKRI